MILLSFEGTFEKAIVFLSLSFARSTLKELDEKRISSSSLGRSPGLVYGYLVMKGFGCIYAHGKTEISF